MVSHRGNIERSFDHSVHLHSLQLQRSDDRLLHELVNEPIPDYLAGLRPLPGRPASAPPVSIGVDNYQWEEALPPSPDMRRMLSPGARAVAYVPKCTVYWR